jgi:hypothetical protein
MSKCWERVGKVAAEAALVSGVLALCLAATFGRSYRLWKTSLPDHTDARQFMYVLLWDVEAIRQGKSWHDLWQLPQAYPEPNVLASCDAMLGGAFLYAPLYLATGNPVLAFNLWLVGVLGLNYLSAYLVARRLLHGVAPAVLAAVLFAFGFVRIWHMMHAHLWVQFATPILFLAAVRMAERPGWRWPVVGGLSLAVQFYCSVYLGYMALIMLATMVLVLAFCTPAVFGQVRFLGRLVLAGAAAAVAMLPLVRPYYWGTQRWGVYNWPEAAAWIPSWQNLIRKFPDGPEFEKGCYFGLLPWLLCLLGVGLLVRDAYRQPQRVRYWLVACAALLAVLACLTVNQFETYRVAFALIPGFRALRCPGRLSLLTLWPVGLLGGWALAQCLEPFRLRAPGRTAVFGLLLTALVFAENLYKRDVWPTAAEPQAEFYRRVVQNLPPGPIADFPLGSPAGGVSCQVFADRAACACVAGFRPTLNTYTTKTPAWYFPLMARQVLASSPEQAASLLGELRLRGIRYVLLHKTEMPPERLACWYLARTQDGQPRGRVVHDDDQTVILDLQDATPELHLPAAWLWANVPTEQLSLGEQSMAQVPAEAEGRLVLRPVMPLQPGRYRATFDVEADEPGVGRCEVVRMPGADPLHPGTPAAQGEVPGSDGGTVALEFTIPRTAGPEPLFDFRIIKSGSGALRLRGVTITPASESQPAAAGG